MTEEETTQLCGSLRGASFAAAAEVARKEKVRCIIETGTYRGCSGDGESTVFFAKLAVELGADFYSIDCDAGHVELAKAHLREAGLDDSRVVKDDSVVFLSLFMSPIGLLYLDSYDYKPGYEHQSQMHQLAEVGAAFGKLTYNASILLDDCNLEGGGKSALSAPFIACYGFRLLCDGYQKLFTRAS